MAKEGDEENDKNSDSSAFPKSFSNRGPNKRKIKPTVESQLIQFDMFSDSEDDEDFVAASSEDDDYSTDNSANSDNETQLSTSSTGKVDGELSKDMESSQQRPDLAADSIESKDFSGEEESSKDEDDNEDELMQESEQIDATTKGEIKPSLPSAKVCGVCLESENTVEDELVECDQCGIAVHEGCYGDADDVSSNSKSDSDAETEPWFCDACKAKCDGYCELCPVKGGILKQTDNGQWVHLICALYVPGVGFRDVDRLQTIVLDDIASHRWGSRRCSICKDQRFSKTGVCIQCDAGLCKTFFHATCAQSHGLLIDAPAAGKLDDEDADPLYAHCKIHTDKIVLKKRIKCWSIFDSHMKHFKQSDDPHDKERVDSAFQQAREDYLEFRKSITPSLCQAAFMPKLMTACPEVCDKLLKKAELMGYSTTSEEIKASSSGNAIKPTLSSEFVNHFFKRETLVSKYLANEMPFRQTIEKKKEEQQQLQETIGHLKSDLEQQRVRRTDIVSKIVDIHDALEKMLGKKISLPNILRPKKKTRNLSEAMIDSVIKICATCDSTNDQHLLALCDTCHNYYHIGCLDPPLSTLPKKGAKWLWQCTECDKSESEDEPVDEEGPSSRKRKRKSNAPQKFTPTDEMKKKKKDMAKYKGKIGRPKKQKEENIVVMEKRPVTAKETARKWIGRKRKQVEQFEPCCICSQEGDTKNMVKCDECLKCYHFDCCDPKLKTNPKKRGYQWMCNECVDSEEDSHGSVDGDNGHDDDDDGIQVNAKVESDDKSLPLKDEEICIVLENGTVDQ